MFDAPPEEDELAVNCGKRFGTELEKVMITNSKVWDMMLTRVLESYLVVKGQVWEDK